MSGEISPKRDAKQKPNQSSKTSKSIDFSYSLSSDMDVDSRKQRRKSRILLVDGSFDLRHMTRDFWLDHRQSVQNGTRCVRCTDTGVRYACTSRSLREWDDEESKRIIKSFKAVFKVQTDLARMTAFVQPVVAARLHQRDMLVIAPLPPNMYLSDLKKLVVHLSHNSVRYYAACILLGLEFMRHSCIYHGNLSLCSIALDYYGRPQITDFDTSLCEKIGEASHQLDALRYAAMLGVLHCDNIRHFSISHMHSTADDHRRRDVFVGICPKCRLTAECMDPKLCDCHNFGALVRYIRNKIVTKEAMRRILESLQPSWMEADLCYSWSRIPRAEEEKILELELMRSASQLAGYSRVSSQFIDPVDDFEGFESDSDAVGQIRISRASMGAASSFAAGTAMTGFGGSQGAAGNFAQRDAIKEAKKRAPLAAQAGVAAGTSELVHVLRPGFERASERLVHGFNEINQGVLEDAAIRNSGRREWRHAEISIRVRVRVDAGADSSAAGRASVEARQAADCRSRASHAALDAAVAEASAGCEAAAKTAASGRTASVMAPRF
ncbi:hypothetical protein BOX15_Mlig007152g2 [Macrostomum lignano]|uniref:Protein kinase domain-containing protein n=1 Tax=Macrostomum lignano TaxID=282301 RepID=A0A267EYK7_9PLAT|nr:hypothetical protein BOX15_Mlig007152g2 [Macrostomum lignano]